MQSNWFPEYNKFLKSPQWQVVRQRLLFAWGSRCFCCKRNYGVLHVHHLSYERYRNPPKNDVRILCVACHKDVTTLARTHKRMSAQMILRLHMNKCSRKNNRKNA